MAMAMPGQDVGVVVLNARKDLKRIGSIEQTASLGRVYAGVSVSWQKHWWPQYPGLETMSEFLQPVRLIIMDKVPQVTPHYWSSGTNILGAFDSVLKIAAISKSQPVSNEPDYAKASRICDLIEIGCMPVGITDDDQLAVFVPKDSERTKWTMIP